MALKKGNEQFETSHLRMFLPVKLNFMCSSSLQYAGAYLLNRSPVSAMVIKANR